MGQTEKIIAGLEPPALEGLTRAPFPDIVKNIYITKYNKNNSYHKELAEFSIDAHKAYTDGKMDKLNDIQKKIDAMVKLIFENR